MSSNVTVPSSRKERGPAVADLAANASPYPKQSLFDLFTKKSDAE
jgi:hypothetical protein